VYVPLLIEYGLIFPRYQPGGSSGFNPDSGIDPLSDANVCLRDATLMQRLGMNAVRVYNLNPDLDHSACASIFNAAGIYMILDVNSPLPNQSLNRGSPWESYNSDYLTRVFEVVEGFMNFNNTLGFFSGNEVINEASVEQVPSYIRAVTRDIKDYISSQSPRQIPVGYSAADVRPLLSSTWQYMSCDISDSPESKIDFFGLNSYSWCGGATFETAGYDVLISDFGNTTIPLFFSEYGCNLPAGVPRVFDEVPALYSSRMTPVFSGGLIYEYSQEPNDYGLVVLNDNGTVSLRQDYNNLRTQYDSLDTSALESSNATATSLQPPACDASLISAAGFTTSFEIPARPDGVDDLIKNGVPNKASYRKNFVELNETSPTQTVYDVNGSQLTGLQLVTLANDQSNLPGNNTSGTPGSGSGSGSGSTSGTTTSSSPSSTSTNSAVRFDDIKLCSLVLGTLTLGVFMHL